MKTVVLTPKEINQIRYPLPKSLLDAAGMLRGKLPNGVKYQQKIRGEWSKRASKLKRA